MRGANDTQSGMFSNFSPEQRVPVQHPLRVTKTHADAVLAELSPVFDAMYSNMGRPSIPPERLLKSQLLIALYLYSVRSETQFCEMVYYNILFRWFLDMNLEDPSFDPTTFTKNRDRLLEHRVAVKFFDRVVNIARKEGLLSDDHFTVDGSLIEACASLKSFRPKDEDPSGRPTTDDHPGNPTVNFRGEKRSNETHACTTDSEALLMKKSMGKEAKLSFGAHALMENRNGLLIDIAVSRATGDAEREAAKEMLTRQARKRVKPKNLGADKGYDTKGFVEPK
jgi:transposase